MGDDPLFGRAQQICRFLFVKLLAVACPAAPLDVEQKPWWAARLASPPAQVDAPDRRRLAVGQPQQRLTVFPADFGQACGCTRSAAVKMHRCPQVVPHAQPFFVEIRLHTSPAGQQFHLALCLLAQPSSHPFVAAAAGCIPDDFVLPLALFARRLVELAPALTGPVKAVERLLQRLFQPTLPVPGGCRHFFSQAGQHLPGLYRRSLAYAGSFQRSHHCWLERQRRLLSFYVQQLPERCPQPKPRLGQPDRMHM